MSISQFKENVLKNLSRPAWTIQDKLTDILSFTLIVICLGILVASDVSIRWWIIYWGLLIAIFTIYTWKREHDIKFNSTNTDSPVSDN